MAGTREGGLKSAAKNKKLYGEEFYARIGALGGKSGEIDPATGRHHKGFALNPDMAKAAGRVGGSSSRRGKALPKVEDESIVHPEAG